MNIIQSLLYLDTPTKSILSIFRPYTEWDLSNNVKSSE